MIVIPAPTWETTDYEKPKVPHLANQAHGTAYKATYELNTHNVTVILNGCFSERANTLQALKATINGELQLLYNAEVKTVESKLEEIGSRYRNLSLKSTITPLSEEEMYIKYLAEKSWLDISSAYELSAKKIFLFENETIRELSMNVSAPLEHVGEWMKTIKKIDEHIQQTKLNSATYKTTLEPCMHFATAVKVKYAILAPSLDDEEFDFPLLEDSSDDD